MPSKIPQQTRRWDIQILFSFVDIWNPFSTADKEINLILTAIIGPNIDQEQQKQNLTQDSIKARVARARALFSASLIKRGMIAANLVLQFTHSFIIPLRFNLSGGNAIQTSPSVSFPRRLFHTTEYAQCKPLTKRSLSTQSI